MSGFAKAFGVGMVWYARDNYARILEVMEDRDQLAPTYDQWLQSFKQIESFVRAQGGRPVHVEIEPDKFIAWCALRNQKVDANARKDFASDPVNWPKTSPN